MRSIKFLRHAAIPSRKSPRRLPALDTPTSAISLKSKYKTCSAQFGTFVEYVPLPRPASSDGSRHPMSVTVKRRARMDYVKPADVAKAMIEAGRSKLKLS